MNVPLCPLLMMSNYIPKLLEKSNTPIDLVTY